MSYGQQMDMYGGNGGYGQGQKMPPLGDILNMHAAASASGGMQMQPRDMPMGQYPPSQLDAGIQQDYVDDGTTLLDGGSNGSEGGRQGMMPQRQQYIEQEEDDDVIIQKATNVARTVNLEETYNALQLPIIVGVLFFLMQLPIVKTLEFNHMAFAFTGDGNWNTMGILINSAAFAAVIFILQKFLAF